MNNPLNSNTEPYVNLLILIINQSSRKEGVKGIISGIFHLYPHKIYINTFLTNLLIVTAVMKGHNMFSLRNKIKTRKLCL